MDPMITGIRAGMPEPEARRELASLMLSGVIKPMFEGGDDGGIFGKGTQADVASEWFSTALAHEMVQQGLDPFLQGASHAGDQRG